MDPALSAISGRRPRSRELWLLFAKAKPCTCPAFDGPRTETDPLRESDPPRLSSPSPVGSFVAFSIPAQPPVGSFVAFFDCRHSRRWVRSSRFSTPGPAAGGFVRRVFRLPAQPPVGSFVTFSTPGPAADGFVRRVFDSRHRRQWLRSSRFRLFDPVARRFVRHVLDSRSAGLWVRSSYSPRMIRVSPSRCACLRESALPLVESFHHPVLCVFFINSAHSSQISWRSRSAQLISSLQRERPA